jgi:hypothetical protein
VNRWLIANPTVAVAVNFKELHNRPSANVEKYTNVQNRSRGGGGGGGGGRGGGSRPTDVIYYGLYYKCEKCEGNASLCIHRFTTFNFSPAELKYIQI